MEYDYIVVGAGSSGSVVAGRLAADPGTSVLLIEYGSRDWNPLLRVPKGFYYTLRGDQYLYRYPVQLASEGGGTSHETWLRGKVAGGSAAVNGMMWSTGAPADWDGLAASGNQGWGWADLGPAFSALEARLGVSVTPTDEPVTQAILASATGYGWEHVADFNAHDSERIGFTPSTIRRGRRVTSYRAFVTEDRAGKGRRHGLTVATRTRAGHLLFDGRRVTGVRVRHGSSTRDVTARREVIICAGAIETPLLLERSGIGHPAVLGPLGITVRAASPRVGARVVEQRGVAMQVRLKENTGPGRLVASAGGRARQALTYILNGSGILATAGYDLVCQFRSSPGVARPDVHGLFVPMAIDPSSTDLRLASYSGILFVGYATRPESSGTVHAGGADPEDPPVITARYLETAGDRAVTGAVLGVARAVLGSAPVADLVSHEDFPGPAVATAQDVVRYALDTGGGIYHAVGSAAMGPDEESVVDASLRVRGVEGLRVADASVLPAQVSGNTAAPAMAVGWRAADLIRAEAG
jgi:choline dehydrogenase-like flavoprotein